MSTLYTLHFSFYVFPSFWHLRKFYPMGLFSLLTFHSPIPFSLYIIRIGIFFLFPDFIVSQFSVSKIFGFSWCFFFITEIFQERMLPWFSFLYRLPFIVLFYFLFFKSYRDICIQVCYFNYQYSFSFHF